MIRVAVAVAVACCAAPALAEITAAEARREGREIELRWRAPVPVDVFVADRASAPASERTLVSDDDTDGVHRLAAVPGLRSYYFLDAGDDGAWVAERLLPLDGGSNFRDLGGYPAAGGKTTKWGLLYRSGAMGQLTDADYDYLAGLGIRVLCDLRSHEERELTPTDWRATPAPRRIEADYSAEPLFAPLMANPANPMAAMTDASRGQTAYEQFPTMLRDTYRAMFAALLAGEAPLSVNCSAGQDRTGVAAALILTALGVPRETIIADYHLSTTLRTPANEWNAPADPALAERNIVARFQAMRIAAAAETGKDPFAPRPLVNAKGEALVTETLLLFERDYGSVEGFLARELGVDAAGLTRLRQLYLE
ncbi:MAG: tyrosine-protein phosphatase [Rhodospirillaceae bacterium]|nr:tyrosine-protein phosphatase [Rhodospirillaceae bacterium]